jgi:cyanophycinase
MNKKLIIIGGHEDKEDSKDILKMIADEVDYGKICIITTASDVEGDVFKTYKKVFNSLGVKQITHLHMKERTEREIALSLNALKGVKGIFFTGGDQLKITTRLGGTVVYDKILELYHQGVLLAGTSAGASVMSDTMLVGGSSNSSYRIAAGLEMVPGLGVIQDMIIDQHFAERGRIGRLLGAVSHNPKNLGIGIDENTCIIVKNSHEFSVFGEGGVYVLDGSQVSDTNISESLEDKTLSAFNFKVHLLSEGDKFIINQRTPISVKGR